MNRLFYISWIMGQYRRRFKAWNRTAYKVTKFALIIAVVAAFVFWL